MLCGNLRSGDIATLNRKSKRRTDHSGGRRAGGSETAPSLLALYLQAQLGLQTVCVCPLFR